MLEQLAKLLFDASVYLHAALGSTLHSIIKWIIQGAGFTKLDADAHVGRRAIALI